jgi:nicotinate-nucleotide pyrophosphorylase (carboxylating)
LIEPLQPETVRRLVAEALAEDVGAGDVTTDALIPPEQRGRGRIVAREALVVCGLPLARATFSSLDAKTRFEEVLPEGGAAEAGATIAVVEGRAAVILSGERVALNFLQALSGIATLARHAVEEVAGSGAVVLDTRKTTPTLRAVEKYAVRVGGARNHRTGLYDAVLVKDNHLAIAGGISEAVRRLRAAGRDPATIEVEVVDLAGVEEALRAGVGRLLLDNFTAERVAEAVKAIAGRAKVEVSGGLKPGKLRAYAEAGVDYLSLGSLTHSAPAVDIALDMDPAA